MTVEQHAVANIIATNEALMKMKNFEVKIGVIAEFGSVKISAHIGTAQIFTFAADGVRDYTVVPFIEATIGSFTQGFLEGIHVAKKFNL